MRTLPNADFQLPIDSLRNDQSLLQRGYDLKEGFARRYQNRKR